MSSLIHIPSKPAVLEFFAGVGLARMGLEQAGFTVGWANDYSADKYEMYAGNFNDPEGHFHLGDIAEVSGVDLPVGAALAWASSPCTDLSLAGNRTGLAGKESSAFYEFIRILEEMGDDRPPVAVLENVNGLATAHGGDDLAAAISTFNELGYSVDALTLDARRFIPQSRPRLFLVAAQDQPESTDLESVLRPDWLSSVHSDPALVTHRAALPEPPAFFSEGLTSVVEDLPDDDARWWDNDRVEKFINSMSLVQFQRLEKLKTAPTVAYRTAYRRTRNKIPVWEMRADDISGCLRTARGGSSKQAVVKLGQGKVQIRWMTGLEYARLMGAGDYELSGLRDSQIHFAFGDAVAVPAVSWLAENYLMPLVQGAFASSEKSVSVV